MNRIISKKSLIAFTASFLFLGLNSNLVSAQILKDRLESPQDTSENISSSDEQVNDSSKNNGLYHRDISLRLMGIGTMDSYDAGAGGRVGGLRGDPFYGKLDNERGFGYGAELRVIPADSWYGFFARFNKFKTAYDNVPNVTPSGFDVDTTRYAAGFMMYPFFAAHGLNFRLVKKLGFWFGYQYEHREPSVETRRDTAINDVKRRGFVAKVSDTFMLTEQLKLEPHFEAFVPHVYTEANRFSGIYKSSWSWEVGASVGYRLSQLLELGVGFYYRKTYAAFDGIGFRGTTVPQNGFVTDVTENNTSIGIPVELRFYF